MWVRWLILGCLVVLLLVSAPEPIDTAAVKAFRQAEILTVAGGRGRVPSGFPWYQTPVEARRAAQGAYLHVIARRPLDPQPWRSLGALYTTWNRPDKAHHAYGQAIRRNASGVDLDWGLAQLYADLGDQRRSVRHWTDYLAQRPDDRAARLTLALNAIRLADWERARVELERLLSVDPTDTVAHAWLGLLLIGPDPTSGMPHLQRAADDPAMATFLAPVFTSERLSAASDDLAYRSALLGIAFLKLDPTGTEDALAVPFTLPTSKEALTQTTSMLALRSLLAATFRDPSYGDAYAYLGQAFDQLGWPGWARASFQAALRFAPQSPVVLTLTGLYWDRHGVPELARHYYQVAYNYDRDNVALCLEIAATYAAEDQYTAAEVWLLFAAEIAPQDPQVWAMLSRFYLDYGVGVETSGLPAATRLIELTPDDAHAHDLAGWAYFLTEKDALAEASLNQALTLNPTLASAHYHLGRLRARQGRYAEAARAYHLADGYDEQGQLAEELDRAWNDLPQAYRVFTQD